MPFPAVFVSGTPYEMGYQHGRAAGDQMRAFADHLVRASGHTRTVVLGAAARFRPACERFCPQLMPELEGLAAGAGISLEEALLLQVRGEVAPLLAEAACTTFAVEGRHTPDGGILIGQTSDMEAELEQFFLVLHLAPEDGPEILMWTFAGQLGYHGLNQHGVAHFANSVWGGPEAAALPELGLESPPFGLPHYPIKRRLYECRTRAEVEAMWRALPVVSSGNYMIATGDPGIVDLEVTPAGFAALEPGEGFLAHANHFLADSFRTPATDAASLPDSPHRQARMTELLRERLGDLSVETLKPVLSDHHGHPCSICRHEETGPRKMVTVAGLIAEPQAGRLHAARGNPCRGDWTTYSLGKTD